MFCSFSLSDSSCFYLFFSVIFSFSQTRVPAAPVSMETAAGARAGRRGSRPTPASAPRATRGRGAIRSYWTCRPRTGTPLPPLLPSWPPPSPPPPQPPLSHRRSQPRSPPPRWRLPPCSHGNPNLARGCWWCHGRQTGWDKSHSEFRLLWVLSLKCTKTLHVVCVCVCVCFRWRRVCTVWALSYVSWHQELWLCLWRCPKRRP